MPAYISTSGRYVLVAFNCWLGGRKGILPVKNGVMVEVGTA